jgi:hypothetical protein
MKKTNSGKYFICLVLTIILIVACFPIGVVGSVPKNNDLMIARVSLKTGAKLTASIETRGTLTPVVNFYENATYNGYAQPLAAVNPASDGPELDPALIVITYQGIKFSGETYQKSSIPPTDAGIYTVTAGYQGDDAYRSYKETKDIKIKPIELKTTEFFTEKPISKIYDGTINVPENSIVGLSNKGILEGDKKAVGFKYKTASFLSKDAKTDGLNAVVLRGISIDGDKAKEYLIVEETKTANPLKSVDISISASILPKPIEVVLVGQDKVYDGSAILNSYEMQIEQNELIQGDAAEARATENFTPWYGTSSTQEKNVGEYYVWANGGFYLYGINGTNADNYAIKNPAITSKKKYAITPASVTVIPSPVSKIQGEPDPALPFVVWQDDSGDGFVKGLYGNDVLYGSLERESGEAVGTYDVYLGSLNNPNYKITLKDGEDKFEILKDEDAVAAYAGGDYNDDGSGSSQGQEKDASVNYFRIALLLVLLIGVGAFFGRNRLTKMD